MATIAELRFRTSIDTSGLRSASDAVDKFYGRAEKRARALPAPAMEPPKPAAPAAAGQAAELVSAVAPLAAQLKQIVGASIQPLTQFAAKFSAQFDKVGGALIGISERIDAAMKFPKFTERIEALRQFVRKTAGLIPKDLQDGAAKAGQVAPQFPGLFQGFDRASDRVRVTVGQIPEALRDSIRQAERVRADLGPLVGDFENAARRVQGAIRPPDDGKGYGLDRGARSRAAQARRRGPGGQFAPKGGFTPTPATEDQLPARLGADGAVIHGRWEIDSKPLDSSIAKFAAVSSAVQKGAGAFGPYGKAAATGLAVATTAFGAGVGTISALVRGAARVADAGLGAWLKWEKLKGFWGTLGSVAEKTIGKINAIKPPPFKFDLSTTITQITKVGGAASAATAPLLNFGKSFAVGLGAFGFAFKAASFVKEGVKEASNLNETLSATDAILGAASPAVQKFSDGMARDFGFVRRETLETATGFGGMAKGLGNLAGGELADFSIRMTKLAADLSSFKNLDLKDASEALRISLSGEQSDTLKKMGVIINETTTKQYALAHGIAKVGEELNEQQKFLARAGQLTEKLKDASGDLEKTQAGAANQLRKMQGSIANVGTAIGQALLPILARGLGLVNRLIGGAGSLFDENRGVVEGFAAAVSAGIGRVEQVVALALPGVIGFGKGVVATVASVVSSLYAMAPSFSEVVEWGKSAFATVSGAVVGFYNFVVGLPAALDGAFGAGTAATVLKCAASFNAVVGAIMLIAPLVTGAVGFVASLVASFAGAVPVVALITTGVLALAGQFYSLKDLAGGVGWAIRNAGDLGGVALAWVSEKVEMVKEAFGSIPSILGAVAAYVRDNWLKLIAGAFVALITTGISSTKWLAGVIWQGFKGAVSLVGKVLWEIPGLIVGAFGAALNGIGGFFANLWANFKSFADAFKKFVQNPTGGVDWKLPEFKLPEFKGGGAEVEKRLAAIAEKERAFQAGLGKPFELPAAPAAKAPDFAAPARVDTTKAEYSAKAALKAQTELESFAKSFKNKVQSPLEEYGKVMDQARKALAAGLITDAEFRRADAVARKEAGLDEHKVAGAVELGSKEAYTSLVSALYGRGESDTSKVAQQTLRVNQDQAATLRQINKKLGADTNPIQVVNVA